jgi:hypothetical protein
VNSVPLPLVPGSPRTLGGRSAGVVGSLHTCTSTSILPIGVRSSCYSIGSITLSKLSYRYTLVGSSSIPMMEVLVEGS